MSSYFGALIVGSRFLGIQSKELLKETCFKLKPEPTNKYDKNAVLVLKRGESGLFQPCGHVARNYLKDLPPLDEEGQSFEVRTSYLETANSVYAHFIL